MYLRDVRTYFIILLYYIIKLYSPKYEHSVPPIQVSCFKLLQVLVIITAGLDNAVQIIHNKVFNKSIFENTNYKHLKLHIFLIWLVLAKYKIPV